MMRAPEKIPAAPVPCTARPVMNTLEFGDVAQMIEPAPKMAIQMQNTVLNGKHIYSRPYDGWRAICETLYATPYQDILSSWWNSLVILGTAVATKRQLIYHHAFL